MNIQSLIVGAIILLAVLYIGKSVWVKIKSFSAKSACGTNCGCGEKSSTGLLERIGKV